MRRLLLTAVAVFGAVGSARADFTIDNFAVPTPYATVPLPGGPAVNNQPQYQVTDNLAHGVSRNLAIVQTQDPFNTTGDTTVRVGSGFLSISTTGGPPGVTPTTAFADLTYALGTPLNLSAIGAALQLNYSQTDLDTPYAIRVGNGIPNTPSFVLSNFQTGTLTNTIGGMTTKSASGFSGVDLANVTAVELLLNLDPTAAGGGRSLPSADFTVTSLVAIGNTPPPTTVPAPPALALGLMALPALGLWRRSKGTAPTA